MTPSLSERILELLEPGSPLDDDEIAARLGVVRQNVNQACRRLQAKGTLTRETGWRGKIVNRLTDSPDGLVTAEPRVIRLHADGHLSEDEVKEGQPATLP